MRQVQPRHARGGRHRAGLSQRQSDALSLEQREQRAFLGVVGLRGVARRGANAIVALADQVGNLELLVWRVAPVRAARIGVEFFGERLSQSVRQRFDQNRVVIVMLEFKLSGEFFSAVNANRERADVIGHASLERGDVIAQSRVRFALIALLAQRVQCASAATLEKQGDVVPDRVGFPEAQHAPCLEQLTCHDSLEHGLRIAQQLPRLLADARIIQNVRVAPLEFPRDEKRRPVDQRDQFLECVVHNSSAEPVRAHRRVLEARRSSAGLEQRHEFNRALLAAGPQARVLISDLERVLLAVWCK